MTPAPEVQGYRGTLLFSQQDPGGPSFAQVTVAIKRPELLAVRQLCLVSEPWPPSPRLGIKARGGSLSPWGTFVQMFRDLLSLNNTPTVANNVSEQHPHF